MAIMFDPYEQHMRDMRAKNWEREKYEQIRRQMYETAQLMPKYADLPRDAREMLEDGLTQSQQEWLHQQQEGERRRLKQKAEQEQREQDALLASPAMVCSISVGIDLWIAKFGDGWVMATNAMVAPDEEAGGMNWSMLYTRLKRLHRMEEHGPFCRIVT